MNTVSSGEQGRRHGGAMGGLEPPVGEGLPPRRGI